MLTPALAKTSRAAGIDIFMTTSAAKGALSLYRGE
jgi:hypothetical protein